MPIAARELVDVRPFRVYAAVLGPLLGGYLFLDRAFAYIHVPGVPLFAGEAVLLIGAVCAVRATPAFRDPVVKEPVLALLLVFMLWGLVRTLPGIPVHGIDAVRDAALWYYATFALLAVAAVTSQPELPLRLARQLDRVTPALLVWLCASVLLAPIAAEAPTVPFTDVSVLSHKPGNAAIAALLVLAVQWLVPGTRSPRSRAAWSALALLVITLAGTQNRGGLLGVLAGGAVALVFLEDRVRVVGRATAVVAVSLGLALLLSVEVPIGGLQGRSYSARQLVTNVVSLAGAESQGNLEGTVDGRLVLWNRLLDKQVRDDRVLDGAGFGPNLAAEVGVFDAGEESLRNPHNSHAHVFARMGALGVLVWVLFWLGWYVRVLAVLRRSHLPRPNRQVTGVCLAITTAVLVSTAFDPQLEGPQGAVLLWTLVGVGLVSARVRP